MRNSIFTTLVLLCVLTIATSNSANAMRMAVLADTHVTPGNENENKLREAVNDINASDVKLVLLAGDLTNEGSDEQLKNIKLILDEIKKPFYIIPGNHENNWSQSACKTFNDLWGNDRFIVETDSIIVVGINCGPYMKMGDGHIKQEDLSWLDKTLASHAQSGKKIVSVNHYPILPDLDNCNDYIRILQKYPVAVHLCGHYHRFRHYKGGDIDALMCRSLDMKNGDYGYTIMDITADSVIQLNKRIGSQEERVNAFAINNNIKPIAPQEIEATELPTNVDLKLIHRDEASIFTRIGVDSNNIYFGNSLGECKSVEKKSGKIMWSVKTDAALFSRPAVTDKYVIFPTADKRLIWLDKKTGKLITSQPSDGPYVADGIVSNGILYQGGYKKFEAWDIAKKTLLWRFEDINNYCQAAPVIYGNDIFFGAWDTYLRNIDKKTGNLKWKWNNGKGANMLGPGNCVPVVTDDKVIVVAPDRYMTAIDKKTGKEIWRSNKYKVRESLGTSEDGKVAYGKTMDGEIVAVSTTGNTYNPLWVIDAELGYEHAPCIVFEKDGVVYVGSKSGKMVAIDPISQKILWSARLGNSEFNGWEADKNGNVYTSLIEGTVWQISKKK